MPGRWKMFKCRYGRTLFFLVYFSFFPKKVWAYLTADQNIGFWKAWVASRNDSSISMTVTTQNF